jgi:hypothetical protein
MAVIDLKNTTLNINDGTSPTPETIEVKIGEGNMTYSEKRNMEYIRDRGVLDTVREGDEEPVEVKFDFTWEYITSDTGATVPTVEEALKKTGEAAAWVSSATDDACAPYAVDIVVLYEPTCAGAGITNEIETITLVEFRWESIEHDLRGGQISVTGNCNTTLAQVVRST